VIKIASDCCADVKGLLKEILEASGGGGDSACVKVVQVDSQEIEDGDNVMLFEFEEVDASDMFDPLFPGRITIQSAGCYAFFGQVSLDSPVGNEVWNILPDLTIRDSFGASVGQSKQGISGAMQVVAFCSCVSGDWFELVLSGSFEGEVINTITSGTWFAAHK